MNFVFLPLSTATRTAVKYLVALIFAAFVLRQARKPSRWLGRPFLWMMNNHHARLTDWGLQHLPVTSNLTILDVGCGGGRTIHQLAALSPEGKIYGIDYSTGSVASSRAKNASLIQEGRVEVTQASVSNLPFPENMFDLVTAVETQYFWPDLVNDMKEVRRVLKPVGTLAIIAEAYRSGHDSAVQRFVLTKLMRASYLSVAEHSELFAQAGFTNIRVFEEHDSSWICIVGTKPSPL
jgi:ubiquinone/menaquinone biosynthesis C-methylase UbiE